MLAALAASLACSCLGILALARFAFELWSARRREPVNLSSPAEGGASGSGLLARFKIVARLLALLTTSAILFWLAYRLARWALAPIA